MYHHDPPTLTPDQVLWMRLAAQAQAGSRTAAAEMTALLSKLTAADVELVQESET